MAGMLDVAIVTSSCNGPGYHRDGYSSTGWEKGRQSAMIPKAIDACIQASDGFFVFDICHIKMYNYWSAFKRGFDNYLKTIE